MNSLLGGLKSFYLALSLRVQTIFARDFAQLEEESKNRARKKEDAQFNHPIMWTLMLVAMIASGIGSIIFITPPKGIATTIKADPETYLQFNEGNVFFSSAQTPQELNALEKNTSSNKLRKHAITLPPPYSICYEDFNPANIWYEFKVSIPDKSFHLAETGLLIPKIMGKFRVFINGDLRDFGENSSPIIALTQKNATILIHINSSTSNYSTQPISASYPLLAAPLLKLRELEKIATTQRETHTRSLGSYLSLIFLFSILFLVYRKNPEVACFVLYFCASFAYSYFMDLQMQNISLFKNNNSQYNFLKLLEMSKSFALFCFLIFDLRQPKERILKNLKIASLGIFASIALMILAAFYPNEAARLQFHYWLSLAAQVYFLALTVLLTWRDILNTLFSSHVPNERKISTLLILSMFAFVFGMNVFDFIFITSKVTTEYRNDLIMNLALSAAVAYEFARARKNEQKYKEIASGEIAERISQDNQQRIHKGFVILVDGIGFTQITKNISNIEARLEFMQKVCAHILERFAVIDGISTLNNTGDGFYFALRGGGIILPRQPRQNYPSLRKSSLTPSSTSKK